jgi:hypothetical protein
MTMGNSDVRFPSKEQHKPRSVIDSKDFVQSDLVTTSYFRSPSKIQLPSLTVSDSMMFYPSLAFDIPYPQGQSRLLADTSFHDSTVSCRDSAVYDDFSDDVASVAMTYSFVNRLTALLKWSSFHIAWILTSDASEGGLASSDFPSSSDLQATPQIGRFHGSIRFINSNSLMVVEIPPVHETVSDALNPSEMSTGITGLSLAMIIVRIRAGVATAMTGVLLYSRSKRQQTDSSAAAPELQTEVSRDVTTLQCDDEMWHHESVSEGGDSAIFEWNMEEEGLV